MKKTILLYGLLGGEADESTTGPAAFMVSDPDGNTILVDQHV